MARLLKYTTPIPVTRDARADEARVQEPCADDVDTYTFPEVITLDEKSYADFDHHVKNPRPPTAALIAIFKR